MYSRYIPWPHIVYIITSHYYQALECFNSPLLLKLLPLHKLQTLFLDFLCTPCMIITTSPFTDHVLFCIVFYHHNHHFSSFACSTLILILKPSTLYSLTPSFLGSEVLLSFLLLASFSNSDCHCLPISNSLLSIACDFLFHCLWFIDLQLLINLTPFLESYSLAFLALSITLILFSISLAPVCFVFTTTSFPLKIPFYVFPTLCFHSSISPCCYCNQPHSLLFNITTRHLHLLKGLLQSYKWPQTWYYTYLAATVECHLDENK
jgi:hypothetical protein